MLNGSEVITIKAIKTAADHSAALVRISELFEADPGTSAGDELDLLTDLVAQYEDRTIPIPVPTPAAAIAFRLEQAGLSEHDVAAIVGGHDRAAALLTGTGRMTLATARALHQRLGVPADILLAPPHRESSGTERRRASA